MKPEIKILLSIFTLGIVLSIMVVSQDFVVSTQPPTDNGKDPIIKKNLIFKNKIQLPRFDSGEDLIKAFEDARQRNRGGYAIAEGLRVFKTVVALESQTASPQSSDSSRDFSGTNVQVEGVDEADIIKTDGDYIYTITKYGLAIARAYPADNAEILSGNA